MKKKYDSIQAMIIGIYAYKGRSKKWARRRGKFANMFLRGLVNAEAGRIEVRDSAKSIVETKEKTNG